MTNKQAPLDEEIDKIFAEFQMPDNQSLVLTESETYDLKRNIADLVQRAEIDILRKFVIEHDKDMLIPNRNDPYERKFREELSFRINRYIQKYLLPENK